MSNADEPKSTCFVIMPFSQTTDEHTAEYWSKHFERFLKPTIEENRKLLARRSEALRENIVRQIIADLVTAPVVVAELTDLNPNVFWELGIRQSFRFGTITIAEEGTKLPFDVGNKGTLFYRPSDHVGMLKFRETLLRAIADCLDNPHKPDSEVLEAVSGRGTLFEVYRRDESIRRLDALSVETQYNMVLVDKASDAAQAAVADASYNLHPAGSPCTIALDVLLAHRYLDAGDPFYLQAWFVRLKLDQLRTVLEIWRNNRESAVGWVTGDEGKELTVVLPEFLRKVVELHRELKRRA